MPQAALYWMLPRKIINPHHSTSYFCLIKIGFRVEINAVFIMVQIVSLNSVLRLLVGKIGNCSHGSHSAIIQICTKGHTGKIHISCISLVGICIEEIYADSIQIKCINIIFKIGTDFLLFRQFLSGVHKNYTNRRFIIRRKFFLRNCKRSNKITKVPLKSQINFFHFGNLFQLHNLLHLHYSTEWWNFLLFSHKFHAKNGSKNCFPPPFCFSRKSNYRW